MAVAAKPRHKLYVINDNTLLSMANQDRFLKLLPFLRSLRKLNRGPKKKTCCTNSNTTVSATYNAAKFTISGLPRDKKERLKALLSARQIRLAYKNSVGKAIQYTF